MHGWSKCNTSSAARAHMGGVLRSDKCEKAQPPHSSEKGLLPHSEKAALPANSKPAQRVPPGWGSRLPNSKTIRDARRGFAPAVLLKLVVDGPENCGADLAWLSMYAGEREVLFPPLTYLKCCDIETVDRRHQRTIITVRPSFSVNKFW